MRNRLRKKIIFRNLKALEYYEFPSSLRLFHPYTSSPSLFPLSIAKPAYSIPSILSSVSAPPTSCTSLQLGHSITGGSLSEAHACPAASAFNDAINIRPPSHTNVSGVRTVTAPRIKCNPSVADYVRRIKARLSISKRPTQCEITISGWFPREIYVLCISRDCSCLPSSHTYELYSYLTQALYSNHVKQIKYGLIGGDECNTCQPLKRVCQKHTHTTINMMLFLKQL